jgi:large subunit ribosomal protein L31
MKKGIHPEKYRLVAFKDMSNEIDGVEYPLYKLEISNTSHPFYTGKIKLVDTAGRVDKFRNRYQKHLDQRKEGKN